MKLSVLMPVYNEERWLTLIVERVLRQKVAGISEMELVLVDDGSTDTSVELIKDLLRRHPKNIVALFHERNLGKGASIRSALRQMTGEICIIQDADLEYDPANYSLILKPLTDGVADCVYGSRFKGSEPKRVLFFWHHLGNKFLTLLSNVCTNLNITDMETGYKAFRTELLKDITLKSERFGFEPEITAKIAKKKCRIYEVGISYYGRTYLEGKKINWKDGIKAIFSILRYWVAD